MTDKFKPKDSTTLPENAVTDDGNYLSFDQRMEVAKLLPSLAETIAKKLEAAAGKPVPFSIVTWGGGEAKLVSNVDRDDAVSVLAEVVCNTIAAPDKDQMN